MVARTARPDRHHICAGIALGEVQRYPAPEGEGAIIRIGPENDMAEQAGGAGHFNQTIGTLPASVATMQRHAPAAYAAYLAARESVYRDPPAGNLDRATTELLFIVLDVVADHEEGAMAHAEAGVRAGLTVGQITEALMIAVLINGHAPWGKTGYKVVEHAARVAGQMSG